MEHIAPNGSSGEVTGPEYSHYKSLSLQNEHMVRWKTNVTLHGVGVPLFISGDHLDFFFTQFEEVAGVKGKTGIATGDTEILLTVDRKKFTNIPNMFIWPFYRCGIRRTMTGPVG